MLTRVVVSVTNFLLYAVVIIAYPWQMRIIAFVHCRVIESFTV
jgi:hypothetical protein